ncbi:MAG: hypothetical protein COT74_03650 [Bdellovibrionales bacterium CG10_big_fil_rev_8_21_14_0_10_45_34]|nr:MAG: hypothetical protein COT74_03650 [Bdellovibrionales bacterium CG10_big_fil_rev_8_21_14_0_10_45_34]
MNKFFAFGLSSLLVSITINANAYMGSTSWAKDLVVFSPFLASQIGLSINSKSGVYEIRGRGEKIASIAQSLKSPQELEHWMSCYLPQGADGNVARQRLEEYRRTYKRDILLASEYFKVPFTAFSCLLTRESGGFEPKYVYGKEFSRAGAFGIAQFMPDTVPEINKFIYNTYHLDRGETKEQRKRKLSSLANRQELILKLINDRVLSRVESYKNWQTNAQKLADQLDERIDNKSLSFFDKFFAPLIQQTSGTTLPPSMENVKNQEFTKELSELLKDFAIGGTDTDSDIGTLLEERISDLEDQLSKSKDPQKTNTLYAKIQWTRSIGSIIKDEWVATDPSVSLLWQELSVIEDEIRQYETTGYSTFFQQGLEDYFSAKRETYICENLSTSNPYYFSDLTSRFGDAKEDAVQLALAECKSQIENVEQSEDLKERHRVAKLKKIAAQKYATPNRLTKEMMMDPEKAVAYSAIYFRYLMVRLDKQFRERMTVIESGRRVLESTELARRLHFKLTYESDFWKIIVASYNAGEGRFVSKVGRFPWQFTGAWEKSGFVETQGHVKYITKCMLRGDFSQPPGATKEMAQKCEPPPPREVMPAGSQS